MPTSARPVSAIPRFILPALAMAVLLTWGATAQAQFVQTRAVGGVAIDPSGMLNNATQAEIGELRRLRMEALGETPVGLEQASQTRKISLRRIDEAIRRFIENGEPIPTALQVLGGMQRVQYVIVDPDEKDVVLVGPGEGWTVNAKGEYVGVRSGRPVMLLDDLIVALRTVNNPNPTVLSCSIDPTPEGLQRLRAGSRRPPPVNSAAQAQQIAMVNQQRLGPQKITVTGVPATSHFAGVMVAADYRMKSISMELEPSPVAGLPSFLQLARAGRVGAPNTLPRFWLAPEYGPVMHDAEGLAWEIPAGAVKALAENDVVDADGVKRGTSKADAVSQRWADAMTEKYEELAEAEPVFGQLKNCIDLAVASAIIVTQNLPAKAGTSFPMLMNTDGVQTAQLNAPAYVASRAAIIHKSRGWLVAYGGVQINPWEILSKAQQNAALADVRAKTSMNDAASWWAN